MPLVEGIWPAAAKDGLYHRCFFLLDGGKTNRGLQFQHSQLVFFSVSSFALNRTAVQEHGGPAGRGEACFWTRPLPWAPRKLWPCWASIAGLAERGGGLRVREGPGSRPAAQPHCRAKPLGWSEGKMNVTLLSFCARCCSVPQRMCKGRLRCFAPESISMDARVRERLGQSPCARLRWGGQIPYPFSS